MNNEARYATGNKRRLVSVKIDMTRSGVTNVVAWMPTVGIENSSVVRSGRRTSLGMVGREKC